MKISAINSVYGNYTNRSTTPDKTKEQQSPDSFTKHFSLPDYKISLQKFALNNISFKASDDETAFQKERLRQKNQKLLDEIKNLEKQIEALKKTEDDKMVKQAKKDIEFYEDFEKKQDYYYNIARKNAESKRSEWENQHWGFYFLFNSYEDSEIYDKEMNYYWEKHHKYRELSDKMELKRKIVEDSKKSEKEKQQMIENLKNDVASKRKLLDIRSLTTRVSDTFSVQGGVEDRIAGYSDVKDKIKLFIHKLEYSLEDPTIEVPNAVLLYGAPGTGKTSFLRGIKHQTSGKVVVEDFNELGAGKNFPERLNEAISRARTRYLEKGQRTILLMDDAESFMAMPIGDATAYKLKFDEGDMTRLVNYNKDGTYSYLFKNLLDKISEVPENYNDQKRAAMTIFITTNYPHLIDLDLIKRPGKMEKYPVNPAEGADFQAVLSHYVKSKSRLVNIIKELAMVPDYEDIVVNTKDFTDKNKSQIIKLIKDGDVQNLNINVDSVPYKLLSKRFSPSENEGAFSNDDIRVIADEAFEKYLDNPSNSFAAYFNQTMMDTKRSIEPPRLKKFIEIYNMVSPKKPISTYDLKSLLELSTLGDLTKENRKNLDYQLALIETTYNYLKAKESSDDFSEKEIKELEELSEQKEMIDRYKKEARYNELLMKDDFELTDEEREEMDRLEHEIK